MDAVAIQGLREFNKALRKMDKDLPVGLRLAMNQAASIVVDDAKPKIPTVTGRAAKSVRVRSTRTAARIMGGSARVAYYPWLDFGGKVGKNKTVERPRLKHGRYLYHSYFANKQKFQAVLEGALLEVARDAGLEVS